MSEHPGNAAATPPLVDVAIITYNHGAYIRSAIESVLNQRLDPPCRLIVGDDCSTDGTREIIRYYADCNPGRIVAVLLDKHVGILTDKRVAIAVLRRCSAPYVALVGQPQAAEAGRVFGEPPRGNCLLPLG
jgi:glycosyltransferase involved in cell wall biosynthesis